MPADTVIISAGALPVNLIFINKTGVNDDADVGTSLGWIERPASGNRRGKRRSRDS